MAIDKVAYWIEVADYDMETAETLYNGRRWLYVAFMCHQAIEKHEGILVQDTAIRSTIHPQPDKTH